MTHLVRYAAERIHETIAENQGLFLLNFYFPLAGPSEFLRKDLEQLSQLFNDAINFGEVELPYWSALIREFAVRSIPTLLLFNGSAEVERVERFWTIDALRDYLQLASSYYKGMPG
ncbi:MAG: thioredoxin family protein [Planctomycetota bacterium]